MANVVLVAGASGLVGAATVERFLRDGWDVVATSRRKPELSTSRQYRFIPLDLTDRSACETASATLKDVTHLVYTAVYEKPGLVRGWTDDDQMQTNLAMLRNLLEPLSRAAELRHVTILQGTKAYGVHLHRVPIPARERQSRDKHANFYWLQEDYLKETAASAGFDFTIMRPQIIVGPNVGVAMNLPPVIGVYAAICRETGLPFGFPGGASYVWQAVDCRLVADAIRWAAEAAAAAGQHFNLTNGEVAEWRDLWPSFAQALGLEPGPDRPTRLAEFLPTQAEVWDRIVRANGLRPTSLNDVLGESHHYADFCFAYGATDPPPPALVSSIKIKQAGFGGVCDTEESFRHWFDVLVNRKILPPVR
ncbi:nucleoside-diphosphate-sugar epimerase [Antricoccus suffuscus]|uniref:Nucleoside-diphosphate-sugar epimerase n=1 Tax=Antricoccus suffuscus TaxID=1629062 RepID=A0A2T0ZZ01_9ACTN|nr:SDR family oxidoreductase [Antricoccus suffuscus]PRZ41589.1 nucleoside-diphosphate-sugar epimerase [Antricoccus suffuscus]